MKRKERIGQVISDRMHKTIVVRVMYRVMHPHYKKIVKRYKKFKVHDEKNIAHLGDIVKIQETRPLSKEKYFRLVEILKKAPKNLELLKKDDQTKNNT